MAVKRLLSCLKKRDLLNKDRVDKSELIMLGESYLQEGLLCDCIDFFEKAEHFEGLSQLRERCAAEGDYFLFNRLGKILEEPLSSEKLTKLGDNALGLGKLLFARSAYQEADNHEKTAQVEKLIQLSPQKRASGEKMLH